MSGGCHALELKEDDLKLMTAAKVHIGSMNVDHKMEQYVYDRTPEGNHIIDLGKTWEKLLLACRAICAIDNPSDVVIIGGTPTTQRGSLKFAHYTKTTSINGRFTPGAFTNYIQSGFKEPRLLIVCDPKADHQPIREASAVNIPVIAFCNIDSPLTCVDIAIPCDNVNKYSIGLMLWMLAREVLRMRGEIVRSEPWEVMVDMFIMREQTEDKAENADNEEKDVYDAPVGEVAEADVEEWGPDANLPVAGMPELGVNGGAWSNYDTKAESSWA